MDTICNEALQGIVRTRLFTDSRISGMPIDVRCCDGCVSLLGAVDRPEQKELAVQLVAGMIGVKEVTDEIVVRGAYPA